MKLHIAALVLGLSLSVAAVASADTVSGAIAFPGKMISKSETR